MDGGCGGLRDFWTPFPDWEATKTGPGLSRVFKLR